MTVRCRVAATSSVLLALLVHACTPPPAAPGPAVPPEPETQPPPEDASASSEPDAGPSVDPNTPSFDQEMQCRREHCYVGGAAHCLDTCYKYNHPRKPEAHAACDEGCRHNYGINECERACALDRRAFAPASPGAECEAERAACRRDCTPDRVNECELRCLVLLRSCESRPQVR